MRVVADTPEPEGFGERLRRLRKERRLSQEALAGAGVSTAHISRLESGARRPSIRVVRLLASRLGVTAEYLESGRELAASEQLELAISEAELALRLGEQSEAAEQRLRELLTRAQALAESALARRVTLTLGMQAARKGRFGEAIELLAPQVENGSLEPLSRPEAIIALAHAYGYSQRRGEAVELLEQALERTGSVPSAGERTRFATQLSHALADLGELERARELLERLEQEPAADPYERIRFHWAEARLEAMEGETRLALTRLRRATALLETTEDTLQLARAHLSAAEILLASERVELAAGHLAGAERLFALAADRRDLASLRAQQALCEARRGDPRQALRLAEQSLHDYDGCSEQRTAWHALAVAHAHAGELGRAVPLFERAFASLSEDAQWQEALTVCRDWSHALESAGRREDARQVREREARLRLRAGIGA
jgi:transcriptional regulator with XRE-family HTH domain